MVLNNTLYPLRATDSAGTPVASQSLTVSTAAVGFTTAPFTATPAVDGVSLVTLDIQVSDVRCLWEGTTPTSTTGHILPASTAYTWTISQFLAARFIRDSTMSVDAVIWASPFSIS